MGLWNDKVVARLIDKLDNRDGIVHDAHGETLECFGILCLCFSGGVECIPCAMFFPFPL